MAEQWYWKHGGETIGPLRTDELEKLVHHHRIFDGDQVQLSENEEWLTGAEVKALFEERNKASTAEAASRLLDQAARRQLNREVEGSSGVVTDAMGAISRRARRSVDILVEALSDGLARVLSIVAPILNRKVVAVVLGVIVVSGLLTQMDLGAFENPRIYERLTAAYQQLQELQKTDEDFSPQQWRAFQVETRVWLDPTIQALEEANAQFPVNSHHSFGNKYTSLTRVSLLDAAKALRSMLDQIPPSHGQVRQFEQGMGGANHFMTGEPDPRYPARNERYSIPDDDHSVDATTLVVIAIDIGLLAGGLFYWFSRRST